MWLTCKRFGFEQRGSVVVPFAFVLPVLVTVSLSGVDFAWAVMQKSALQTAADASAIAGAKELSLSDAKRENVAAVVQDMVLGSIGQNANSLIKKTAVKPTVTAQVIDDPLQVVVTIKQPVDAVVGGIFGIEFPAIEIISVARVVGKPNICVLALDTGANKAISLEHNARVTGRNCAVYSNSAHTNALVAKNSATLTASFICSRGGKSGGPGNFDPPPLTDCPGFEDPLAGRVEPVVGACDETDLVVSAQTTTLRAGTYCGGLTITDGSVVELEDGVYTFKDGPLVIDEGSSLKGQGVGFYLTGADATLRIDNDSSISLAAPTSGALAGLLIFESRSQPLSGVHKLLSNNAPVLLGTIYLSRGELRIDAEAPIAQDSAYTAIVARTMRLYGGPHLILNTNYDQTDVPVPKGIRGAGQPVALVK